jgi:hypothetical protein
VDPDPHSFWSEGFGSALRMGFRNKEDTKDPQKNEISSFKKVLEFLFRD